MRVLCFVDYYLPGYKAGGPIRTIINMVEQLGDEIEFLIVTRDRDFKSNEPYSSVQINDWNTVGSAKVFYASPESLSFTGVARLLRNTPHDLLYLNSFLSPRLTGLPLLLRWLGFYGKKPVILAPRGEFSPGALALKRTKKQTYLMIVKAMGLCRNLIWQASCEHEATDIRRGGCGLAKEVFIAPDLLPRPAQGVCILSSSPFVERPPGPLRVVFLSRISPMKNLDYLLAVVAGVSAPLQLNIYGPVEDRDYWGRCAKQIDHLPAHISVRYCGEVTHEQVSQVFAAHDVFVFPTRGENFGHVIFEALNSSTSVIVSDQTPWQADFDGAVEVLSLDNPPAWIQTIERWAGFTTEEYSQRRRLALSYAREYMNDNQALEMNRHLFRAAFNQTRKT